MNRVVKKAIDNLLIKRVKRPGMQGGNCTHTPFSANELVAWKWRLKIIFSNLFYSNSTSWRDNLSTGYESNWCLLNYCLIFYPAHCQATNEEKSKNITCLVQYLITLMPEKYSLINHNKHKIHLKQFTECQKIFQLVKYRQKKDFYVLIDLARCRWL